MVTGHGSQIQGNDFLEKCAKRKGITKSIVLSLIDVATAKGDMDKVSSYWNTWHCQNTIIEANGVVYANYCKNRFCTVCTAIRKAEKINKYYPVLSQWSDLQFVTVTAVAQPAKRLNFWIGQMDRAFKRIKGKLKKRYQRGEIRKFRGLRSLECNFNPIRRTYNPHFHIIMEGKEMAELFVKEWLKLWNSKKFHASPKAQKIKPIDDLEKGLKETIKYGIKLFTETDLKKKGKKDVPRKVYAKAMHNIIMAMEGRRIFDRFGFNLPKEAPIEPSLQLLTDYKKWVFPSDGINWINPATGENLTTYKVPPELHYLLTECIDKESS